MGSTSPASPSTPSKPISIPTSFSSLRTSTSTAMPLLNSFEDDDIFYSDDDSMNSSFCDELTVHEDFLPKTSFNTIENINNIVHPVDQISSGMKNLFHEIASSRPSPSYSAITRRSPTPSASKSATKKIPAAPRPKSTSPITITHSSTPYRFVSKNPVADPRYSPEQQLMLGPIPGHLDHDNIYNSLRAFFQQRGPVQFMFIHKGAVKIQSSGDKTVKFGYVVFTKKGPAQAILKEGAIAFAGHSIKVKAMNK